MATMHLKGITKTFGSTVAVDNLDLEVPSGELTCLLGPSGCGKTTTLRMLGGFIEPDAGDIMIGERSQLGIPPNKRPTSLVFQDYALFPHLTVLQNIGFGLRRRKVPKHEIRDRVAAVMDRVGLSGLEQRFPGELSGGQQQRVALSRSLVLEPSIILMDEPLSNLDAKIRVSLRSQLRSIQADIGATILYVTHDQEEALSLGDHIAVMNDGRLCQVDTPQRIYHQPTDRFVAEFIGMTNWITGVCVGRRDDRAQVDVGTRTIDAVCRDESLAVGDDATVSVRPEHLAVMDPGTPSGPNAVTAIVQSHHFHGAYDRIVASTDGTTIVVDLYADSRAQDLRIHDEITLTFSSDDALAFAQGDAASSGGPDEGETHPGSQASRADADHGPDAGKESTAPAARG